jgi:hypothetical protein
MANPFSGGSSGGASSMMLPLMMMASMQQPAQMPGPPAQQPMGTPATNKPQNAGASFIGGAAAAPTQSQTGAKTLLGQ